MLLHLVLLVSSHVFDSDWNMHALPYEVYGAFSGKTSAYCAYSYLDFLVLDSNLYFLLTMLDLHVYSSGLTLACFLV